MRVGYWEGKDTSDLETLIEVLHKIELCTLASEIKVVKMA